MALSTGKGHGSVKWMWQCGGGVAMWRVCGRSMSVTNLSPCSENCVNLYLCACVALIWCENQLKITDEEWRTMTEVLKR